MSDFFRYLREKISSRPLVHDSIISLIGNGLGRIGGLAASVIIAAIYGADVYTDTFYMVFAVFTFFIILIQGALDLAFIPLYAEVRNKNALDKDTFLSSIALNLLVFTAAGTFILDVLVRWLAPAFLSNLGVESVRLISKLTSEMSPALIGITVSSVFISAFNAEKWFFAAGLMPFFPSLGMIVFSFFLKDKWGIHALSTGLSFGAMVQLIAMFLLLGRRNVKLKFVFYHYQLMNTLKKTATPLFVLLVFSALPIVDRIIIANYLAEGNITAYEYALKLCQIPWSLATIGYINVFFSWWSQKSSEGDLIFLNSSFKKLFYLSCIVYIPLSLILFFSAQFLVKLVFGYGNYSMDAIIATSNVFGYYCLGYWAFMLRHTLIRYYMAQQNSLIIVKTAIWDFIIHLVTVFFLIKKAGISSIGIAASIGYTASLLYLYIYHLRIKRITISSADYV
jgi:putative peptidoglycan lipid II flippase